MSPILQTTHVGTEKKILPINRVDDIFHGAECCAIEIQWNPPIPVYIPTCRKYIYIICMWCGRTLNLMALHTMYRRIRELCSSAPNLLFIIQSPAIICGEHCTTIINDCGQKKNAFSKDYWI